MEFKNVNVKALKNLKAQKGVAVVTLAAMLLTLPTGLLEAQAAETKTSSIMYSFSNSQVMTYFYNLSDDIAEGLAKTKTSINLKSVLNDYKILYNFIYENEMRRGTYYKNLTYSEQNELNYLLQECENQIYQGYENTSYFKTTTKSVLGHYIEYSSTLEGYIKEHEDTIEYYTETKNDLFDDYLNSSKSKSQLEKALVVYKDLLSFVKGTKRVKAYTFPELTQDEQQEIYNLLTDWTYDLYDEYSNYYYYESSCKSKIGWVVNEYNLNYEMGQYIGKDIINFPQNPIYPTVPSTPVVTPTPSVPSTPVVTPTTPNVEVTQPAINTTIGKDWHANYINPNFNTSRTERDYIPEYIDENNIYNNNQNTYGFYDAYGNYFTYNQYNQYQDGYVEDYVPTYVK